MKLKNIALWVSAMTLISAIASCGASSPDLMQPEAALPDPSAPGTEMSYAGDLERSASYTPGLFCPLAAGFNNVDIFKYGWKAGNVTENAAPKWVKLKTINNVQATILYKFQETGAGRLKQVKIHGLGSRLLVQFYNYNTGVYDSFGAHNLSNGAVTVNLPLQYAPNGVSWMRLTEAVNFTVQIDKIEASVLP